VIHQERFTQTDLLVYQPSTNPGGSERACVIPFRGLTLRRLSTDEMEFDASGSYFQSWVILPNYRANGIQFLYGFRVESNGLGTIKFQLSPDNGTTWYYYKTALPAGWVVAGSTNWNTKEEVDLHLSTFPITSQKQVRVKVQLTPSAGGARPIIHEVTFYVHLQYDFQDDILRSLKHHLERGLRLRTTWTDDVSGQDTITYPDSKWENIYAPITVYNLTTDPNRTTNLFSSIVDNKTVKLVSQQLGRLESTLTVQPEVFIAAEEFVEVAVIPSIVVNLISVKERRDQRDGNGEYDIAAERRLARHGYARVHFDAEIRVTCQSALKHEVIAMSEAVDRVMTHDNTVLSEATGDEMGIPSATPFTMTDRFAQGLFAKDYSAVIFGKAWLRNDAIKDLQIATTLRVSVGVGSTEAETEVN